MVLSILRYVSHHPWGSIRAEANRRRTSIQQIIQKIWDTHSSPLSHRKFVAGGGVLWTPVHVSIYGRLKTLDGTQKFAFGPGKSLAWLASRQPPLRKDKTLNMGIVDPLHLDLTDMLPDKMADPHKASVFSILYDCRFLLRFDLSSMPMTIVKSITGSQREGQIIVRPHSKWYWPTVIWRRAGEEDAILGTDSDTQCERDWRPKEVGQIERNASQWIQLEWIRSLKAI
jgi:tRNA(Ile)-lysidine synthase